MSGSRFFRPHPEADYQWDGVCEVLEDGRYVHHPAWPERRLWSSPHTFSTSLDNLLVGKHWEEIPGHRPEEEVGEGL